MTQTAKLTASDGAGGDTFGYATGISGDTVVVGAHNDQVVGGDYERGSVYVFVKPPTGWVNMTQMAKLTSSDGGAYDLFGISISISGDTIVAAAQRKCAAYVFVKPPTGWANMTQTARLDSSSTIYDYFGYSAAISGDTVAIGAPWDGVGSNSQQGSVYAFVKPGGGWSNMTETAKLTASDGGYKHYLGLSVAISGDRVAAIGGNAAYVFDKPTGGWAGNLNENAKLTNPSGLGCGGSTPPTKCIAVDADTIVATSFSADSNKGAGYVFGPGRPIFLPLILR
jgi:hypothetical protein